MKVWLRLVILIACGFSIFGLCLRLLINANLNLALMWLFMPEPYRTILTAFVTFGTVFSILLLGFLAYSLLKNKDEIKL